MEKNNIVLLQVSGVNVIRVGKCGMDDFKLLSVLVLFPNIGNLLTVQIGVFWLEVNYKEA